MKTSWKAKPLTISAETELQALGENLRIARERRKMSVTDLAERLDVDRRVIQKLERGDPTVALGALLQALSVFGLARGFSQLIAPENDIETTILEARKFRRRRHAAGPGPDRPVFNDDELDF